jgi:signal transduction histidine kinase
MRTLPPDPTQYTRLCRAIVAAEVSNTREMLTRHGFMVFGIILLTFVLRDPVIAAFLPVYICVEGGFIYEARRVGRKPMVTRTQYRMLLAQYVAGNLIFCLQPLWLFSYPQIEVRFLGMCILGGFAIHALTHHAATRDLAIIDGLLVSFSAAMMSAIWWINAPSIASAVLISLGISGLTLYFLSALHDCYLLAQQADANRRQLVHAQKVEAIGRLSGGIAHDFNNLLTVITGNLDLQEFEPDPLEQAKLREEARAAANRGARLVRALLASSRKSRLELESIAVAPFMAAFVEIARRVVPANLRFVHDQETDSDLSIITDRVQLEAALLNLINNARDAMEGGAGLLRLHTRMQIFTQTCDLVRIGRLRKGQYLMISVQDTGTGIPAHLLPSITDPYVTTKSEAKGSGLGLAMVNGFAQQTGGTLDLASTAGKGTHVHLYLPL